jgi:hypothetical protein
VASKRSSGLSPLDPQIPNPARLDAPPRAPAQELGSSGLRRIGGYVDADFLPELRGVSGAKKFGEMAANDPIIAGMLFAVTMLLRRTKWTVTPNPEGPTVESKKAAELVDLELMKRMEGGWPNLMANATSMVTYGYAPCEVTYIKRAEGYLGVRKIALRWQETIERWEFDDTTGQLLGLWQMDWIRPRVFIPVTKLVNFRTTDFIQNPEGKSALRGAYVPWMRKKAVEEAEGRAALRAAGIVKLTIPGQFLEAGADDQMVAVAASYKALAAKLAQDQQGAVLLPSDVNPETKVPMFDVTYVVADGRRPGDMTPILERMDKRIAGTVLADFILLGQQSVGSFALSSDKTALFATALAAWLDLIAGALNQELMPRWWALNGWPEETMPVLTPGDVQKRDLTELGGFLTAIVNAGMPLFPDPETQKWIRQEAGLPEVDEAKLMEDQQQAALDQQESQLQLQQDMAPPDPNAPPGPVQKALWARLSTLMKARMRP